MERNTEFVADSTLHLAQRIIEKANEINHLAASLFDKYTPVKLFVELANKYRYIATADTMASQSRALLVFNKQAVEYDIDHILNNTVPHEMAHVVVEMLRHNGTLAPKQDHGPEWRSICSALGGDGKRLSYHFPLHFFRKRRVNTFRYTFPDGNTVVLSSIIHRRIQNGMRYALTRNGTIIQREYFTSMCENN